MIKVRLWDFVGTGLVIKAKTGIVWTNQVGGTACLHPECEGVFVPISNDTTDDGALLSLENALYKYFEGEPGGITFTDEAVRRRFKELCEDNPWRSLRCVELDPTELEDSFEAWVHVIYTPPANEQYPLVNGLGAPPYEAILTWTNTD